MVRQQDLMALTLASPRPWLVQQGVRVVGQPRPPPAALLGQVVVLHAGQGVDRVLAGELMGLVRRNLGEFVTPPPLHQQLENVFFAFGRLEGYCSASSQLPPDCAGWVTGAWCWLFRELVLLPRPLWCRGQPGVWHVGQGYRALLRAAYLAAAGSAAAPVVQEQAGG
jgi:hypothetical protein